MSPERVRGKQIENITEMRIDECVSKRKKKKQSLNVYNGENANACIWFVDLVC